MRRALLIFLVVPLLAVACSGSNPAGPSALPSSALQEAKPPKPLNVNGTVAAFAGDPAAFQFQVGETAVQGDAATVFLGGSQFGQLADGVRVEVKGEQRPGYVYAVRLHASPRIGEPPDDDTGDTGGGDVPDDDPPACLWPDGGGGNGDVAEWTVSLEVIISSITGTAPDLTIVGGNRTFNVSEVTRVRRNDDWLPLDVLRTGLIVRFYATQRPDASLDAAAIEITRDTLDVAVEGEVSGVSGGYPSATFSIDGTTFLATEWTTFVTPACEALTNGAMLKVRGVRLPDGVTVLATAVEALTP